jgi:hypothetical protein
LLKLIFLIERFSIKRYFVVAGLTLDIKNNIIFFLHTKMPCPSTLLSPFERALDYFSDVVEIPVEKAANKAEMDRLVEDNSIVFKIGGHFFYSKSGNSTCEDIIKLDRLYTKSPDKFQYQALRNARFPNVEIKSLTIKVHAFYQRYVGKKYFDVRIKRLSYQSGIDKYWTNFLEMKNSRFKSVNYETASPCLDRLPKNIVLESIFDIIFEESLNKPTVWKSINVENLKIGWLEFVLG